MTRLQGGEGVQYHFLSPALIPPPSRFVVHASIHCIVAGMTVAGAPTTGPTPAAEKEKPNVMQNMWTGMTSPFTKGKIMCVGIRKDTDAEGETKKEEEKSDEKPDVSLQWLVMFWTFVTSPFAAMNKGDYKMSKEMAKKLSFSKSQPPGADDAEIDETAAEVAQAAVEQALKAEDLSEDGAVPASISPETSGKPKKRGVPSCRAHVAACTPALSVISLSTPQLTPVLLVPQIHSFSVPKRQSSIPYLQAARRETRSPGNAAATPEHAVSAAVRRFVSATGGRRSSLARFLCMDAVAWRNNIRLIAAAAGTSPRGLIFGAIPGVQPPLEHHRVD